MLFGGYDVGLVFVVVCFLFVSVVLGVMVLFLGRVASLGAWCYACLLGFRPYGLLCLVMVCVLFTLFLVAFGVLLVSCV